MSVINQALSQLVAKQPKTSAGVTPAQVKPVTTRPAWVWMVAGFTLSIAVGGWAVSQQAITQPSLAAQNVAEYQPSPERQARLSPPSPTQYAPSLQVPVYRLASVESALPVEHQDMTTYSQPSPAPSATSPSVKKSSSSAAETSAVAAAVPVNSPQPTRLPASSPKVSEPSANVSTQMSIERVQLAPEQLAAKAVVRAERALAQNDFNQAVSGYSEALRYTPLNETIRQQLAALYYGKGEIRQAFDLLQRGMQLNHDGETLRIALARMLLKEQQPQAALTPLTHLPETPSIDYLSLRAAIAQRNRVDEIALQSYQLLTEREPSQGRWWLGLAIAQERTSQWSQAQHSYQQALNQVGLSSQSHLFIRERLQALSQSEENSVAN